MIGDHATPPCNRQRRTTRGDRDSLPHSHSLQQATELPLCARSAAAVAVDRATRSTRRNKQRCDCDTVRDLQLAMISTLTCSLALRRQLERATDGFGPEASYNECMKVPNVFLAGLIWFFLAIFGALLLTSPTRALLNLPSSIGRRHSPKQLRAQSDRARPRTERSQLSIEGA